MQGAPVRRRRYLICDVNKQAIALLKYHLHGQDADHMNILQSNKKWLNALWAINVAINSVLTKKGHNAIIVKHSAEIVVLKTSSCTHSLPINGQIIKLAVIKLYKNLCGNFLGLTYTSLLFDTGRAGIVVQQRLEQQIERSDLR